jgi:amidophosphoribosyltransferase
VRVGSPPFLWPCYFGTDIPSKKDLIAVKYATDEIRERFGADSLGFLSPESLRKIGVSPEYGYCDACFTGNYPVG